RRDGAVKQLRGRACRRVAEIDVDRVALRGADAAAVVAQREAALRAGGDDLFQVGPRDRPPAGAAAGEQGVDVDPAGAIQLDADRGRTVPQDEGQEAAGGAAPAVVAILHAAAALDRPANASLISARSRSASGDSAALARCITW